MTQRILSKRLHLLLMLLIVFIFNLTNCSDNNPTAPDSPGIVESDPTKTSSYGNDSGGGSSDSDSGGGSDDGGGGSDD